VFNWAFFNPSQRGWTFKPRQFLLKGLTIKVPGAKIPGRDFLLAKDLPRGNRDFLIEEGFSLTRRVPFK